MTTPTPDCLRQEARIMRSAAKRIWSESEDLLARATALNRAAQKLEAEADTLEDIQRIQTLHGGPVRLARKERVA
jgi:cytochrome c556